MQDQDLLGAEDKAKEIKKNIQILLSKKENGNQESESPKHKYSKKPSNMYAIYGGWGTGKTRLLEELKGLIENDYKVVWFRPWEYFEESQNIDKKLLSILLDKNKIGKCIQISLIIFVIMTIFTIGNMQWFQTNIWQNFIALHIYEYSVVIGGITIAFVILLSKFNLIQYISNLAMGGVSFNIAEIFSKFRDYTESSEEIQEKISSKIKAQTIVFVDDLDRCRKETVVEVLEHIKHFYASDKVFFVFAIDRKSLATYIAEHYNYQIEKGVIDFDRGYQYLDKLFPDSYNLRYLDGRKLLAKYLKKEDNKIYDELTDTDRENYFLLIEYYATFNWRKVEALIDKFAEIYKKIGYTKVVECDDNKFMYLDQIFRWCLVHEFYPEVFEERNWRKEVIEKFYKSGNLFQKNALVDGYLNKFPNQYLNQFEESQEDEKVINLERIYNYSGEFYTSDSNFKYKLELLNKLEVSYEENDSIVIFSRPITSISESKNWSEGLYEYLKICLGFVFKRKSDKDNEGYGTIKIAKMKL